jgi:glycosyltransferase involved in cell wall biosynthesis
MNTPLKILFITDRFPPQIGGMGRSADRLTHALADSGHTVHVLHLAADINPGTVQSQPEGDLMVHRVGTLASQDVMLQIADNVICSWHERVGFDIFHGHFVTPAGYLATVEAGRFGVKSYVSVRGNDVDRGMFDGTQLPLILWTFEHADAVGCVSRELLSKCKALSGREVIHCTPNSVDLKTFRPMPKDENLLRSIRYKGETILGFVGELRFKKGTHFILDAFLAVHHHCPSKLLLVGGMQTDDRLSLKHFIHQYPELRHDIHAVDYTHDHDQLAKWYNLIDIVLSPSLWDGMPNNVLEAMACERCVIASDVGGIRDLIKHGETGYLVDVHDLDRFGEGCIEVVNVEEKLRTKIGKNARRYVAEHHSPEKELEQLQGIYVSMFDARSEDGA